METQPTYIAFLKNRRIARGAVRDILPTLKREFDEDAGAPLLVFDAESGRQRDFDLRGSLEDVLDRAEPRPARGPGRPRLGVVSREVTLLPRHWEWLEQQPSGISGALRRLVEEARRAAPGAERARQLRDSASRFMTAMAGDLPGFEEASRALFAKDQARFEALVDGWPPDVRDHLVEQSREATRIEG